MKKNITLILFLLISVMGSHVIGQVFDASLIFTNVEGGVQNGVTTADLDGDGLEDLIIAGSNPNVAWIKNNGNGTFGPQKNEIFDDEIFGEAVRPLDYDLDGDMDIAAGCSFSNVVILMENRGDGTFEDVKILEDGLNPLTSLITHDLDEDGDKDIVFCDWSITDDLGAVYWLQNNDGEFSSKILIGDNVFDGKNVSVGDLDGDDFNDVVIASDFDDKLRWYRNEGDNTFSDEILLIDDVFSSNAAVIADIDRDGDKDIVHCTGDLLLWENDGNGEFTSRIVSELVAWDVAVVDVTHDGYPEIFIGSSLDKEAVLFINDGTGEFNVSETYLSDIGVISDIWITDINNDNKKDIITSSSLFDGYLQFINLSPGEPLSTSYLDVPHNVLVYPNPSSGKIYLESDVDIMRIEIYTMDGVLSGIQNRTDLNMSKYNNGQYILKIIFEDGQRYSHLIQKID